ncbi:ParA family protein [Xenorhabdus sp. XENO-1]|uniref:division plane positioning ATPase MipZ n=1 Tax=Xenorhabdus bovienii TaxID=40576 RepID=UPI0020CA7872|nr:division plane positioning ATPase MipZ [Xenorhabdus bovienii]MCP9270460.1 ParA family protein [Xenorhabdus bovienii subsp. africana]
MNKIYQGLIIAVAVKKGGKGKSTIVINIAPEVNPDVIYDTDDTPAISTANSFRDKKKQWNIVRLQAKSSNAVNDFINELITVKEKNQCVLIDCGGFDSAFTRAAIAAADMIIAPVADDFTDMLGLVEFDIVLQQISKDVGEKKIAHVLLNKMHPSRKNFSDFEEFISSFEHLVKLDTSIPTDKAIPQKFGEGYGIVEQLTTSHGRGGNAMRSLFFDMRDIALSIQNKNI